MNPCHKQTARTDIPDMESLKEYLLATIDLIVKDKKERCVLPSHAMMEDVMEHTNCAVRNALNEMVAARHLRFHRTLNSVSFELTPPKDKPDTTHI